MPPSDKTGSSAENRLLSLLPRSEQKRLAALLDTYPLHLKDVLHEAHSPIPYVYFPTSGVISLVVVLESSPLPIEICTIGNEGMAGMPVFFGTKKSTARAVVQIPGEALRMKADVFAAETSNGAFGAVLRRYAQAMMTQLAQSTACNSRHSIEQRMCRWLLLTHDRVGADEFPLTQEFLAQMLGVRRPSVTVVASLLQKAGLIGYQRGRIRIRDRPRLEASSCECYRAVANEFDRLLR